MIYDLILKNGFIIDGTGNPGFYGDIAIKDNLIAKIDSKINSNTNKEIDILLKMCMNICIKMVYYLKKKKSIL